MERKQKRSELNEDFDMPIQKKPKTDCINLISPEKINSSLSQNEGNHGNKTCGKKT
jgi:hypothetical protein